MKILEAQYGLLPGMTVQINEAQYQLVSVQGFTIMFCFTHMIMINVYISLNFL